MHVLMIMFGLLGVLSSKKSTNLIISNVWLVGGIAIALLRN